MDLKLALLRRGGRTPLRHMVPQVTLEVVERFRREGAQEIAKIPLARLFGVERPGSRFEQLVEPGEGINPERGGEGDQVGLCHGKDRRAGRGLVADELEAWGAAGPSEGVLDEQALLANTIRRALEAGEQILDRL